MSSINKEKVISLIAEAQKARAQLEGYTLVPMEVVLASTENWIP